MKVELTPQELVQLLELTRHDEDVTLAVERLTDVDRRVLSESYKTNRILRRIARHTQPDVEYQDVELDEQEGEDDESDLDESERTKEDAWN